MKLTTGTGFIGMTLLLMMLMGSCSYGEPHVEPWVSPEAEPFHLPTHCRPLYNLPGYDWAICMGVGPK